MASATNAKTISSVIGTRITRTVKRAPTFAVSVMPSDTSTAMPTATTLRTLDVEEALAFVDAGACFVDIRDVGSYLDVHIPGSISLQYEFGPGFNSRARDCVPLEVPLVLLDLGSGDMVHAAASLRGKGFEVSGRIDDGINRWVQRHGSPASTEIVDELPDGVAALHVNDPGAATIDAQYSIPIEDLWTRTGEVTAERVAIVAGFGVRAAIAVGILERTGKDVLFWRTLAAR